MSVSDRHPRRRRAALHKSLLAAVGALALCPAAASAQATGEYPASSRPDDVLAWIAVTTTIRRDQILIMTPEMVVALVRTERLPDGTVDAAVREEVIEPQQAARMGARSLATEVAFDCATHRRRFLGDVAYPRPDLRGFSRPIQEPSDWGKTQDGTITAQVEAAVCAPSRVPQPQPPTSRPALPPPAAAAGFVARIGTFTKEPNARAAAESLRDALPPGGRDQKVVVWLTDEGPQRYYVVEAQGFADRAEAEAFCQSAARLPACIVLAQKPIASQDILP